MLNNELEAISQHIVAMNPNTFNDFGWAGFQGESGKVIFWSNRPGFEGKYIGLQDTKGNFLYNRYTDVIPFSEPEERYQSCTTTQGVATIRQVAQVKKDDINKLSDVLVQDIQTFAYKNYPLITRSLQITNVLVNQEAIAIEETGLEIEKLKLAPKTTLVAVEFTITFNQPVLEESCIERDLCSI